MKSRNVRVSSDSVQIQVSLTPRPCAATRETVVMSGSCLQRCWQAWGSMRQYSSGSSLRSLLFYLPPLCSFAISAVRTAEEVRIKCPPRNRRQHTPRSQKCDTRQFPSGSLTVLKTAHMLAKNSPPALRPKPNNPITLNPIALNPNNLKPHNPKPE